MIHNTFTLFNFDYVGRNFKQNQQVGKLTGMKELGAN